MLSSLLLHDPDLLDLSNPRISYLRRGLADGRMSTEDMVPQYSCHRLLVFSSEKLIKLNL